MTIAAYDSREEKFKWLIRPFQWAFSVTLMTALFGFSLATDPTINDDIVIAGLIAALGGIAGILLWGVIRLRAAYEG